MWIWPENLKGWLIGTGLFANFVYSTDIGYCRFILYCGLIGFGTFIAFLCIMLGYLPASFLFSGCYLFSFGLELHYMDESSD